MTNIFEYSNIFYSNIYSDIRSYQIFHTNIFIYSFVSKNVIRIYSDIRSCHFIDTNIFGYSFVSKSIRMSHSALSLLVKTPLNLLQHRIDVNHIFLWDSRTSSNSWHLVNRNNGSCYLKLSWRILRIALGVKHTTSKCELFIEFFSRCRWQLIGSLVNEISTIESILFLNLFMVQSSKIQPKHTA